MPATRTDQPSWETYWSEVSNEAYMVARELIESLPGTRNWFERWLTWDGEEVCDRDGEPTGRTRWIPELQWDAAAAALAAGTYLSSGEARVANVAAGLVCPEHHVALPKLSELSDAAAARLARYVQTGV